MKRGDALRSGNVGCGSILPPAARIFFESHRGRGKIQAADGTMIGPFHITGITLGEFLIEIIRERDAVRCSGTETNRKSKAAAITFPNERLHIRRAFEAEDQGVLIGV